MALPSGDRADIPKKKEGKIWSTFRARVFQKKGSVPVLHQDEIEPTDDAEYLDEEYSESEGEFVIDKDKTSVLRPRSISTTGMSNVQPSNIRFVPKARKCPQFGHSPTELLEFFPEEPVPSIIITCTEIIRNDIMKEGIFRIPGRATNILEMKISYEQGNGLNIENPDTHDVAGLLSQFFRELPEPLLTDELYDDWVSAVKRDEEEMKGELAYLVRRLPEANANILKYFIDFLCAIAKHGGANRMGPRNLALVFGASLLNPPPEKYDLESIKLQCQVVENLITHFDEIFEGKLAQVTHFKANRQKTVATIPAGPAAGGAKTPLPSAKKNPLRKRKGFFLSQQYSVNTASMQTRTCNENEPALGLADVVGTQSVSIISSEEEKKRKKRDKMLPERPDKAEKAADKKKKKKRRKKDSQKGSDEDQASDGEDR